MALIMWVIGAIVAPTGFAVYLEYGTVSVLPAPWNVVGYPSGVTGVTSEWGRKKLSRICLQTSQVYGNLYLCHVRDIHCEGFPEL